MKLIIILFCLICHNAFCQKNELVSSNGQVVSSCGSKEDKIEKSIHPEWVEIDKKNIEILNKLYNHCSTLDAIEETLPNFTNNKENNRFKGETYDCGYNLKSTHHQYYGGYGFINVSILYFENKVLKIRLTLDIDREIVNGLLYEIKFPLQCLNNKLVFEKTFKENINDYRKNYGNLFIEFEDENSKRQNVLNHFSDVLSGSTFEKPYYLLYGFNSPTKDYVRYLIATKDLKGLKQLLYSPSPTARLISANALIYLKENYSEEENQKINEIIKNGQMIKGGVISCWTHKFDYNYYDVNKYFEKYFLMD